MKKQKKGSQRAKAKRVYRAHEDNREKKKLNTGERGKNKMILKGEKEDENDEEKRRRTRYVEERN